ncbi:myotubularin-related protein 10-B [Eupeodes corollae]|uniref:myotubularin-related protein 10-B n=1 Tax=Eupeodes corollae TaxID=290404 RepID=UPI0024908098|nr:myotubularin-related protein 10-B [Eupeodes corollae]
MTGTPAKQKYSFTSYVNSPKGINGCEGPPDLQSLKPKLLADELEVASAPVYLYPPTSKISDNNLHEAILGLLTVTNFKLSFMAYNPDEQQGAYQENLFLGKNDVTLNNIDYIYQVVDKKKRLLLVPEQKISSRIDALHIICKNFRLLKFSFKSTARDQGKVIASALARFAFPSRHDLSFAFCFKEHYYNTVKSTVAMFTSQNDWAKELIRCGVEDFRVVAAHTIKKDSGLPPHFVIPKCYDIEDFKQHYSSFNDSRSAFWVYGYAGANLIRMGELKAEIPETTIENVTLELIRKSDPERKPPHIMNLSERLPSIQDIQQGYLKFRQICTPDSPRQFLMQETKYLTLLEKSGWLLYVSLCLSNASEAATQMRQGTTVVLQENNGRDLCCIISSLTQIILDPLFRTIDGFQSLMQKEWVALEHPFLDRLGHVFSAESSKESPLLLLFLDCVWQLLQQFPEEFEYSQTYLTTIWDSAFLPIFDTFQFNTEQERFKATEELKLVLRPVWDWSEQFADKDKVFFTNPFYQKRQEVLSRKSIAIPPNAIRLPGLQKPGSRMTFDPSLFSTQSTVPKDRFLEPKHNISHLEIWEQCYYRWIPILEIKSGGFPQIELFHRLLLNNIGKMQRALETRDFDDLPESGCWTSTTPTTNTSSSTSAASAAACTSRSNQQSDDNETVQLRTKSNDTTPTNSPTQLQCLPTITSFFPFSTYTGDSTQLTDILTNSNELIMEGSIMERLSIAQFPD